MGNPGCGKTTVGKILGEKLNRTVIDVDDDVLEPTWRMSVSEKLFDVGGERFLEEEGQALCNFPTPTKSVISLSGSNPLHQKAMRHTKQNGVMIFLDVPQTDILDRLEKMKVDRIVGQEAGIGMAEILNYRQSFYEKQHDIRVTCCSGDTPEIIASKLLSALKNVHNDPGYVSTRGSDCDQPSTFLDTVLQGLAKDGGLFVRSTELPTMPRYEQQRLIDMNYSDRALRILHRWINPLEIPGGQLRDFVLKAYSKEAFQDAHVAPVRHLEKNQYLLELFHGPTASFKDYALQLMPQLFSKAVRNNDKHSKYLILVATSGDTGGAVLDGFRRHSGTVFNDTGVIVLYPLSGISELQKHQMTTMDGRNISVVGVNSNFDFCQSTIKQIFNDIEFNKTMKEQFNTKLSAANSLNWGRLIPQIVYHASGYLDLVKQRVIALGDEIDICVPTGNFGNILAAYYVKMMGFPIRKLICASNSNDVLTEFFITGCYNLRSRHLLKTSSPAIDILKSSNLERLLYHTSGNNGELIKNLYQDLQDHNHFSVSEEHLRKLQSMFVVGSCSEEECKSTIVQTLKNTGYLLDPHTAVAKTVADRYTSDVPTLITATAHYGKFGDSMLPWVDRHCVSDYTSEVVLNRLNDMSSHPPLHLGLKDMCQKPITHTVQCQPDIQDITKYVVDIARKM
ncbi:hypothetical protein LOTGIDRAFT_105242 [Lottia gigantea]|uniref:Threonine synthase N-terminal domain-containing protein n=1 Tax=Lottia gigantea TaxID=225164 RepID=V4A7Y8_LOTGI|nr:hypothetical protein LOTGIDRAFT_105242 [Lottia gigantea]ESO91165.1 hypothetical protein LOTGIDRAFT_105242 [Lottia gigantea]